MPRTLCGWVCFALALLIPASRPLISATPTNTSLAVATSDKGIGKSVLSDRPTFRLGGAAKPFGWSTVIGDFNRDGKPDVAVADHVGRRANSYAYRLEFSISGQAPHDVTFESSRDAITISVADVDRDNDLDVIVGTPLSGETIGIWLNDGHGHFTAGDVRQLPATIRPVQSLSTTDPVAQFAASELSSRRADDALPAVFRATLARSDHRFVLGRAFILQSALASARTNPRAPPSAFLDVLS